MSRSWSAARAVIFTASFSAAFMVQAGAGAGAVWAANSPMLSVVTGGTSDPSSQASEVAAPVTNANASTAEQVPVLARTAPVANGEVNEAAPSQLPAAIATKRVPTGPKLSCVDNAMQMAAPLLDSIGTPGSAKNRGVYDVIAQIKAKSAACAAQLFADGTAAHPNAGLLTGNGFTFTAENCVGARACAGGNGGALLGNGGHGANGGDGGDAGWYGGTAGNGGDSAIANCSGASCVGGPGGRAGRYGRGGAGGDGAPGYAGGNGGVGGLLGGAGFGGAAQ